MVDRDTVLDMIRQLAQADGALFRVHITHTSLYSRARRIFGSWAAALAAAGIDYNAFLERARQRALRSRRPRAGAQSE